MREYFDEMIVLKGRSMHDLYVSMDTDVDRLNLLTGMIKEIYEIPQDEMVLILKPLERDDTLHMFKKKLFKRGYDFQVKVFIDENGVPCIEEYHGESHDSIPIVKMQ